VEVIFPRFARDRPFPLQQVTAILAPPEGIVETGDQSPFAVRVTWGGPLVRTQQPARQTFLRPSCVCKCQILVGTIRNGPLPLLAPGWLKTGL